MTSTGEQFPLGYSEQWIALGIVSAADIQRDQQECACGEDLHPEHYRWRAFATFLSAQHVVSPELARALYTLGSADADRAMGGSMMAAVLSHRDCPSELLRLALTSERPHLQRLATQRLTDHVRHS